MGLTGLIGHVVIAIAGLSKACYTNVNQLRIIMLYIINVTFTDGTAESFRASYIPRWTDAFKAERRIRAFTYVPA